MTLALWICLIVAGCVGMVLGTVKRLVVQAMAGIGWWTE